MFINPRQTVMAVGTHVLSRTKPQGQGEKPLGLLEFPRIGAALVNFSQSQRGLSLDFGEDVLSHKNLPQSLGLDRLPLVAVETRQLETHLIGQFQSRSRKK